MSSLFSPFTTMMNLLCFLTHLGLASTTQLQMVEPGPSSGNVLKEQPGLLITYCHLHMQRVFVRFDPLAMCQKNVPSTKELASWAGVLWRSQAIQHAEADISYMLEQLQKFTITRDEQSGANRREKRFITGLLHCRFGHQLSVQFGCFCSQCC